jgi:hypothetical protein
MAQRALAFVLAHPDGNAAVVTATAELTAGLERAGNLSAQQFAGIQTVRSATAEKMNLRRRIRSAQLDHLVSVARFASREVPELTRKFRIARGELPNLEFRTMARGLMAEAESRKDVLVKHGLDEAVLTSLATSLDQFDAATGRSTEGRRMHVAASLELKSVTHELLRIVAVIDSCKRLHLEGNPDLLAEWTQTSSVVSTPRATPEPAKDPAEVKPAA